MREFSRTHAWRFSGWFMLALLAGCTAFGPVAEFDSVVEISPTLVDQSLSSAGRAELATRLDTRLRELLRDRGRVRMASDWKHSRPQFRLLVVISEAAFDSRRYSSKVGDSNESSQLTVAAFAIWTDLLRPTEPRLVRLPAISWASGGAALPENESLMSRQMAKAANQIAEDIAERLALVE